MTPQERQLIDDLFDRLSKLESAARDPDAERAIADGLKRAPHAPYALVQTALVQDEALKRANARIEDLQAQLNGGQSGQQQQGGGFLDSMREAVFGHRDAPRGSVPTVRPQAAPSPFAGAPGYQSPGYAPAQQPMPGYAAPQPGYGGGGFGGSFLGTAASTAAGVVGGGLLLDGIRSMFGHHSGFAGAGGYDAFAPDPYGGPIDAVAPGAPWGAEPGSDLARDAGINDIGGGGQGFYDPSDAPADGSGYGDDGTDYAGGDGDYGGGGGDDGGSDYA